MNEQEVARLMVRLMGDPTSYNRMLSQAAVTTNRFTQMIGLNINSVSFTGLAVKFASMFEMIQTSFGTMLGSDNLGRRMMSELRTLAAETPLTLTGVTQGARELLQYGVAAREVIGDLRRIGDVSGQTEEQFHRMVRAFGQVMEMGSLQGQERRQMINAGFNPIAEISRTTGRSIPELMGAMRQGAISAQMVRDAFISVTSEGGRFSDAMLRQSRTLTGVWSNFRDDVIQALATFGKDVVDMLDLRGLVRRMSAFVNDMRELWLRLSPSVRLAIVQVVSFTSAVAFLSASISILMFALLPVLAGFGMLRNLLMMPFNAFMAGLHTIIVGFSALKHVILSMPRLILMFGDAVFVAILGSVNYVWRLVAAFQALIRLPLLSMFASAVWSSFAGLLRGVTFAATGLFTVLRGIVSLTAAGIMGALTALGPVFWTVFGVLTAIAVLFSDDLNPATFDFASVWRTVKQAAVDLFNYLFPVFRAFQGAVRGIGELAVTVWNEMGAGLSWLFGFNARAAQGVGNDWRTTALDIRRSFNTALIFIEFWARRFSDSFKAIQLQIAGVMSYFADIFGHISNLWVGMLNNMGTVLTTWGRGIRSFFTGLAENFRRAFSFQRFDWSLLNPPEIGPQANLGPAFRISATTLDLQRQWLRLRGTMNETWEQFRDRRLGEIEVFDPFQLPTPEEFEDYGADLGRSLASGLQQSMKDWDHVLFNSAEANRRIQNYRERLMGLETDPNLRGGRRGAQGMTATGPNVPDARDVNAFRGNEIVEQLRRVNANLEGNPPIQVNRADI